MPEARGGWRRAAPALALIAGACIPQVEGHYREPAPVRAPPPAANRASPYSDAPAAESAVTVDPYPAPPPRDEPPPPRYRPPRARQAATSPTTLPPAPRPVWEARPAAADAQTVVERHYQVRPGDTLSGVAERTGAGAGAIARANGLAPPFTVVAGDTLMIPGGRYHLVRPGQSGIAIARAYGVEWSRIVAANDLTEPFVLQAGARILIPAPPAGTNRVADRAAAFTLDIDDILTGGEPAPAPRQAPARAASTPGRVLPATAVVAAPARFDGTFTWPVEGRILKRFGPGASGERNDGVEIAAAPGTPIRATASGVVAYVGDGIAALGGLVLVKHGDGWTSVYGHAGTLLVQRGQAVRQGQTVALSGATGHAERPEVHFELRKGRAPVDPLAQLPRR